MKCAFAGRFGLIALTLLARQTLGQTSPKTSVDLQVQGRNPDFSAFSFTRPMTVGTALPTSCQVGQFFFNSAAASGANMYACTSANLWTAQASGASMTAQLGDFAAVLVNGSLTIGGGCSESAPCNVRIGSTVHSFKNPATVSPSDSNTGLVLLYIDGAGNLTAASTAALTCNGCTYASSVTAFPANSIPLFIWTLTSGVFDVAGGTDFRALLSTKNLLGGTGILVSENAGTSSISIDASLVGTLVLTPPATSSTACLPGQFAFDTNYYYVCIATNTWKRVSLLTF